jgi:hypothetical protein
VPSNLLKNGSLGVCFRASAALCLSLRRAMERVGARDSSKVGGIVLLVVCLPGMAAVAQSSARLTQAAFPAGVQKPVHYDKLPLDFEPNEGQASNQVQWLARGPEYTLFLAGDDAILELDQVEADKRHGHAPTARLSMVWMKLIDASPSPESHGEEPLAGFVNYFNGNDPAKWQRKIGTYGRVHLRSVYPGIDLAYYGRQGQLEYDFMVAPNADPSAIRLAFDGAAPRLAGNGDLLLSIGGRELRFSKPTVYQVLNGKRHAVDGGFAMAKNGDLSFRLGRYDHRRELVIDPTLVYTGTFGTASENDAPAGMAVDAQGELIIAGTTFDLNFPATAGAFQTSCGPVSTTDTQNGVFRCAVGDEPGAMSSAYVAKLSADGTSLVYATYLHGVTGWENAAAVQADASGNAVVIGQTSSADFPLVNAPAIPQMSLCQPILSNGGSGPAVQNCSGYFDGGGTEWTIQGPSGFVSKLSADGSSLLYSAFLGFSGATYPQSLALDSSGNMYILNTLNLADPDPNPNNSAEVFYPTNNGFQTAGVGDIETALTVLSADGQTILYSTIWGETKPIDSGCGSCLNGTLPSGVAVGQNGMVFIAGETRNTTLPVTAGTVQTSCLFDTGQQCYDNVGYVAAFDITKSGADSLAWATYISGPNNPNTGVATQLNAIAADADNKVYITGYTTDALFPTTKGSYNRACPVDSRGGANFCDWDIFVSKLNPTGTAYEWSTFLAATEGAGSSADSKGIALDTKGNVYVYGDSGNLNIPAVNALPQYPNDWWQPYPFLSVLNPTGSSVLVSTQIAPNNYVGAMENGMALDPDGNIYLVGNTQGGQTYSLGNTTLTSWPTTKGTYTTPTTGTGPIPFFAKIGALGGDSTTRLSISPSLAAAGEKVTFSVTVSSTGTGGVTPTGSVKLTSGTAVLGEVTLTSGKGTHTTTSLPAGVYAVEASYAGDSLHGGSSSPTESVTVISPASAQVVSGASQSTVYGEVFPHALMLSVKGTNGKPLAGATVTFSGEGLKFSSATATTSAAGEASVTVKAIAAGTLKAEAKVSGLEKPVVFSDLAAAQAKLTISAVDLSVRYGEPIPKPTYTVAGLVNGDTRASIHGAPTETTPARKDSPAGTYPITIGRGSLIDANYKFVFVTGTVKIIPLGTTAAPKFSPVPKTYTAPVTISFTTATPGATIYYTTNGDTPTTKAAEYSKPFAISKSTALRAMAIAPGYAQSAVVSGTYNIEP